MPRPDAPRPARRSGWSAEALPPCPRCRHPMVRWSAYRNVPQRPEGKRSDDEPSWWLPTSLSDVLVITGLSFLWSTLSGFVSWGVRGLRLAQLSRRMRPDDWVCASCLHSRPGSRSATR